MLAAYKGSSGGVIVYAVQLDAAKPADAADFVTAYLLKEGAEGHAYDAKGGQVYYLRDTSTCSLRTDAGGGTEKSYQSYVIVKPNHPVSVNGKTYNYLLIYAPMDFNTHILKSLVIG